MGRRKLFIEPSVVQTILLEYMPEGLVKTPTYPGWNTTMINKDSSILIVGAGAFGTSTAYHLAHRGYKSIRVLDPYPAPSAEAASTDISKIIRSDYNEPLYATLGMEAIKLWESSSLFKDIYHVPGWILGAKDLSIPFVEGSIKTCARLGVNGIERMSPEEVRKRFPVVTGELDGWNSIVWNPTAGWANSGEALQRMASAAKEMGVHYIEGENGRMKELICGLDRTIQGVIAADGTQHVADLVVLAAGAWCSSLVDLKGQLTAKGHSVAHIQLTPEEQNHYSNMPVMDNLELGYFFPPTSERVFKLAHSVFTTNTQTTPSGIKTSIPHTFMDHPEDDLPLELEAEMRQNLRRVFPELADRPFCFTRFCWDADTADRHWLVDAHPEYKNLHLACGGSAHSFKFLPNMGKYVADYLEGTLDPETAKKWRWRAGEELQTKNLAHLDPERELVDLTGWKGRRARGLDS